MTTTQPRNILVLGAASAIAVACARRWAAQGARFLLVARNAERLDLVAADLLARGASAAEVHVMDMTDFAAHAELVARCARSLQPLDIALVAHGTLPDAERCAQDAELAVREFTTNATSTIALLTRLAPVLRAQGRGSLAVVSSVAGDRGRPSNYLYGAAKAAVSTYCEGLRAQLFASGVHVMTVKPGFVDTPMTRHLSLPGLLLATPDAVARRIVRGIEQRRATLYTPGFWRWIMLVIRCIPETLFKRLKL